MHPEIIIRTKYDASKYSIDTLIRFISKPYQEQKIRTYNNAKGEDISRFVQFSLEMRLGTAPVVVSSEHTLDAPAFGKVCGIFAVNDLDAFNDRFLAILTAVNQDIVRLDI
jgi:hypothetical protein